MALPLGKLSILVGAGLVGSYLANEGRIPNVSDLFSGAFRMVLKGVRHDEKTATTAKPRNDTLLAQVNSLREELQLLASSRPVTIVTSTSSGSGKYGVIVIVIVVGYGYVWWKGWKLPDMMFATKRGLSDACNAVAKQLDNVYGSISAAKRHLSSRIDRVDCRLDEYADIAADTKEEVSALRGSTKEMAVNVQSVHHAVYSLEDKLNRIEGKQDNTNAGVARLLRTALAMEKASMERIQGTPTNSSIPALELPQRASSMPPISIEELPSSPPASPKVKRPLENSVSVSSGLKALHGASDVTETLNSPKVSNGLSLAEDGNSTSRVFGRTLSSLSAVFSRNVSSNRQ